jgi:hypothetical protein
MSCTVLFNVAAAHETDFIRIVLVGPPYLSTIFEARLLMNLPLSRLSLRFALLAACTLLLPLSMHAQRAMKSVAGVYNAVVSSPQGDVKAVITIKRENNAYAGTLAADGFPVLPLSNIVPSDTGVTMVGDSPDGGVNVSVKFGDADKVSGTVLYQGTEMTMVGTFAPADAMTGAAATGPAMEASGTYELKSTEPLMGQAEMAIRCTITKAPTGALGGVCGNEAGEAPISNVSVVGNVVTLNGDSPVGPFKGTLTVVNGAVTGTLALGSETAKMKGTFVAR